MAIPNTQLDTWANQGAIASSKATHTSIRAALTAETSPVRQLISSGAAEIYLQGSYKNDTNIRADSDVDVVVELHTTFNHNIADLPEEQRRAFAIAYPGAVSYTWTQFRNDVLEALRAYYGTGVVKEGNRALKIPRLPGRVGSDVVVVQEYQEYSAFWSLELHQCVKGVAFYTRRDQRRIINFPKLHYENGCAKNSASETNGNYKATVRMFKNARSCLVDRGQITAELAPSYFVECLVHNVPSPYFFADRNKTMFQCLSWLWREAVLNDLMCQNGRRKLLGAAPEQWAQADAVAFIKALVELWDNWK